MVQCHLCQSWLHEDCAGVHEPPVGLWTCQQCRRLPSMVSDIAACTSQLRDTNIELRDMAREQQRELAAMGRQLTVLMDSHYAPVSPTDSGRCDVDGFTAVTAVTRSTADTTAATSADFEIAGRCERATRADFDIAGRCERATSADFEIAGRCERATSADFKIVSRCERATSADFEIAGRCERATSADFKIVGRCEREVDYTSGSDI